MGAFISIKYISGVISQHEATTLATSIKQIVEDVINDNDVFVYLERSESSVGAEPIEIFVQVNENKVKNYESLSEAIGNSLKQWKKESSYKTKINLNLIPVKWFSVIDI